MIYLRVMMRGKMKKIVNKTVQIIGSKYFFWGVLALFVFQAAWIAFSFVYPMLYDESFHVGVIAIFSHQLSPFILNQPQAYDAYGNLANGGATMFHYLMSFPYRLILAFTDKPIVYVIFLRLICIAMVAVGIQLFNKLFQKIGIRQVFINIGMLLFILLPIVPFVAATVNYDNMLFMLTALFLITCVNILASEKVIWYQYVWVIVVGCFASLVKFTFLPVFAVSVVYLVIVLCRRYGKQIFSKTFASFRSTSKLRVTGVIALTAVVVGMFSAVYLQNVILYRSLQPSCEKVLSIDRCNKNGVYLRDSQAEVTKNTRPLAQDPSYISQWVLQMVNWTNMTGSRTVTSGSPARQPLPIIYTTVFLGGFIGLFALLYSWRSIKKKPGWHFLVTISVALTIVVFMVNYSTYIKLHAAFAIQPRYVLSMVPIIIVMIVVAVNFILRKARWLKLTLLIATLLLLFQGGGLITHIVLSEDTWYWQNSKTIKANHFAKKILQPFVGVPQIK